MGMPLPGGSQRLADRLAALLAARGPMTIKGAAAALGCSFYGAWKAVGGDPRFRPVAPGKGQPWELRGRAEPDEPGERAQRAAAARKASYASGKRRRIDPATCERDYTADDLEFQKAVDRYKREAKRPFPTLSELLEVVRSLGYVKP